MCDINLSCLSWQELLKRTVLFDADDKPAHLINFDEAHHCGLWLALMVAIAWS